MASSSVARQVFSRLPPTLRPRHYNVRLKPDLKAFTFKGWVKVDLEVLSATSKIVCNAADMTIHQLHLDSNPIDLERFKIDPKAETLTVELSEQLKQGCTVRFSCAYTGILNDQMKGFYRSKYSVNDEERYCAVTQFEATDARRCFPCWDEPALKATFSISVIAPEDRDVYSNMLEVEDTDKDMDKTTEAELTPGFKLTQFGVSPIMSTYLVAVVVGEFEALSGQTQRFEQPIQVRVLTLRGQKDRGEFALRTSVEALEFYSDFFDVKYPLPKYDCIAIPDFAMGAMENWGLVTFRESRVLVDEERTSSSTKEIIAIVLTHEMAHMWFGNLVTMEWWTHLWLNEGFASFMEYQCTDTLYPEFDIWTTFVADTLIPALELDALDNSHPIEVPVNHPSEIDEIFDNISYNKGAAIIRMLFEYIGTEHFRVGMRNYLEKYSYQNTETNDLWRCLEEASKKPVQAVMSTWTSQMGFPVIKIDHVEQKGDTTVISLTQEKFNADGSRPASRRDGSYLWQIPIEVITSTSYENPYPFLLEWGTTEIPLPNPSGKWFKINNNFTGYFRVQYPKEILATLTDAIANGELSELNRLNLLDDLMALVQAGHVSANQILEIIPSFKGEESYVIWKCINHCFAKFRVLLADDATALNTLDQFQQSTLSDILEKVGWKERSEEPHTRGLLRMMVISRMGILGHADTVSMARQMFEAHVSRAEQIPANLRSPVYCVVAANGDQNTFNQLVTLFRESELSEERDRIARAMGCFKDVNILQEVLDFAVGPDVRSQDAPFVIRSVASKPKGRDMSWAFFQNKFDFFFKRYSNGPLMSRLITFTTDSFTTEERAQEVHNFFSTNKTELERTINQSIETIRLNSAWLIRDGHVIKQFLAENTS